jgi:hypothetical protein
MSETSLDDFPLLSAALRDHIDFKQPDATAGELMTLKGTLPPWAILSILGIVGGILLIAGNVPWWSWGSWPEWGHGLARDTGIALLTTAILGFTVDRWLKLDIAIDVFRAALGYVLPDAFREEVRRISNYKMVAERHVIIFEIERLDQDVVRVTCMLERTVRNISSETQPYKAQLDIDEWGFQQEQSKILECEIRNESGASHRFQSVENRGHYIHARTEEIAVPPQGRVFISSKFTEIRRANDDLILVSVTPSNNPEINVQIPDDFEYQVSFGHPNETIEKARYSSRHTMKGTYFPAQAMRLRWWPKSGK